MVDLRINSSTTKIFVKLRLIRVESLAFELVDRRCRIPERVAFELVPGDSSDRILLEQSAQKVIEVVRKVGNRLHWLLCDRL